MKKDCCLCVVNGSVDLVDTHWRRHQNDTVATHKQHRNGAFGGFVHFLVGFLIDFNGGHGFLCIAQHHIQMLVERLLVVVVWENGELVMTDKGSNHNDPLWYVLTCNRPRSSRSLRIFT